MSKISAFLKSKKAGTKKAAVDEVQPVAEPVSKVEGAVAVKEEWTKDVVDVEIVPVAVRKTDGASDFEDDEMELPSSVVKMNFKWGRSAESGAAKAAAAEAEVKQAQQPVAALGGVLPLKARKKIVDDWIPLEAASTITKTTAWPSAPSVAPAPQEPAPKKPKERRNKAFLLTAAKEGDDKIVTLSSKDIWAVVDPWPRATFLQTSA